MLRSWLERQQNCPICRTSVFAARPQAAAAPAAPQGDQPAEGAAGQQQAVPQQGADEGGRPVRYWRVRQGAAQAVPILPGDPAANAAGWHLPQQYQQQQQQQPQQLQQQQQHEWHQHQQQQWYAAQQAHLAAAAARQHALLQQAQVSTQYALVLYAAVRQVHIPVAPDSSDSAMLCSLVGRNPFATLNPCHAQVQMAQMLAAHQAARSSQGPAVQQNAGPAPQPAPVAPAAGQQPAQGAATQQPGVGAHSEPPVPLTQFAHISTRPLSTCICCQHGMRVTARAPCRCWRQLGSKLLPAANGRLAGGGLRLPNGMECAAVVSKYIHGDVCASWVPPPTVCWPAGPSGRNPAAAPVQPGAPPA